MKRACLLVVLGLLGCGETVSPEPLGDYAAWPKKLVITGEAPGHGDTYRIIYANDVAAAPPADPSMDTRYPEGSILVKEIYDLVDDGPGALDYVAIMRRLGPPTAPLTNEGDWLFSEIRDGTTEVYKASCWNRCHVAAPFNGAWYDYRK